MAISHFFFPGNLATFEHIFHKNALYESPTGFFFGHQVTRISHKKREENAHLISHLWSQTINGSLATHLFPLVDCIFPPSNHSWAVLAFYEEPPVPVLKFLVIRTLLVPVPVPVPCQNGTLGPVLVPFLKKKKIQISIPVLVLEIGHGFGVWFWNWICI
jgi:hypothetical protein